MRFPCALVALSLAAGGAQQEPPAIVLQCPAPPGKTSPRLRLEGTVPLPDETVLRVTLLRAEERWSAGRLTRRMADMGVASAVIRNRRVALDRPVEGPGYYRVVLELATEDQDPAVLAALRDEGARRWELDFRAWGGEFVEPLVPGLRGLDERMSEALRVIDRYEEGSRSSESWAACTAAVEAECDALLRAFERSEFRDLYPAAVNEAVLTLRSLKLNGRHFNFGADGALAGVSNYHNLGGKALTHRREDFGMDALRGYVRDAVEIAGREFCLWVVAEVGRAGWGDRLPRFVNEVLSHPGVEPFADRLMAPDGDLDALEKELRAPLEPRPQGP